MDCFDKTMRAVKAACHFGEEQLLQQAMSAVGAPRCEDCGRDLYHPYFFKCDICAVDQANIALLKNRIEEFVADISNDPPTAL